MKEWPEFNDSGDLPMGIHTASLEEVLNHFGNGSPQREAVAQRLKRIHKLAHQTGKVVRFIVYGSFVTTKMSPNDIDIFLIMDDSFEVQKVEGEASIIFNHMQAHNYEGGSIFWVRRIGAFGGEENAVNFWQTKRNGKNRGIVEVITK